MANAPDENKNEDEYVDGEVKVFLADDDEMKEKLKEMKGLKDKINILELNEAKAMSKTDIEIAIEAAEKPEEPKRGKAIVSPFPVKGKKGGEA